MKSKAKSKKIIKGDAAGIVLEDIDSKLDLIVENMSRLEGKVDHLTDEVESIKEEMVVIRGVMHRHDLKIKEHDEAVARF